jgi:magnesium transporter
MSRFFKHASKKAGLPPGTLVHVGERKVEEVKIRIMDYRETHFEERELATVEELAPFLEKPAVKWIDVIGIHQVDMIQKIGNLFDLHPLVLEDIVHTDQRPKLEDFEDYIFVISKMLTYEEEKNEIVMEQVSLVLGENYIISFQEREGDVFNLVRERIRRGRGRLRKMGCDYLAYALLDAVVDHYFVVLEKLGERIESLEEELTNAPTPETLRIIHYLKRELILLRKLVWPLREVLSGLEREGSQLIQERTTVYLKDLYDHTIQVVDTTETFRDMVSGMLDIYLSSVSNKMNQVMKLLTIIATIFIPLTFIVGIYGMNFEYMPELAWPWGYPFVWVVMLAISLLMVLYFKRKKWL